VSVKKVIAKDQRRRLFAVEEAGVAGDMKRLGEAVWAWLFGVREIEPDL
jgi:hypothetical protein